MFNAYQVLHLHFQSVGYLPLLYLGAFSPLNEGMPNLSKFLDKHMQFVVQPEGPLLNQK